MTRGGVKITRVAITQLKSRRGGVRGLSFFMDPCGETPVDRPVDAGVPGTVTPSICRSLHWGPHQSELLEIKGFPGVKRKRYTVRPFDSGRESLIGFQCVPMSLTGVGLVFGVQRTGEHRLVSLRCGGLHRLRISGLPVSDTVEVSRPDPPTLRPLRKDGGGGGVKTRGILRGREGRVVQDRTPKGFRMSVPESKV